jgi:hypothetical protein
MPMDAEEILRTLERHRVRYVLIGGLAAQTRGWRGATEDIDITPADDRDNLARLAAAVAELEAGFRVDPNRYPSGFKPPGGFDADTFRGQVSLAFTTNTGCSTSRSCPTGRAASRISAAEPAASAPPARGSACSSPLQTTSSARRAQRTGRRTSPSSRT